MEDVLRGRVVVNADDVARMAAAIVDDKNFICVCIVCLLCIENLFYPMPIDVVDLQNTLQINV